MWWNGLCFLKSSNDSNDQYIDNFDLNIDLFHQKVLCNEVLVAVIEENNFFIDSNMDIKMYFDFLKLLRVTALVYQFTDNLRKKVTKKSLTLCKYVATKKMKIAQLLLLKSNQYYLIKANDFESIKRNLNILKDEESLFRTFSRFNNANLPYDVKAPIVLCKSHKLPTANLIAFYFHSKVLHNGVKQTLNEFRTEYWISSGRSFAKKLLNMCVVYKKINPRYPTESDLPKYQFNHGHPFTAFDVDYLRPLYCLSIFSNNDDMKKVYFSLYTCTSTRAIILDVPIKFSIIVHYKGITITVNKINCSQ